MKKKISLLLVLMFAFAFLTVPNFDVKAETNETIVQKATLKYNANGGKKAPKSTTKDVGTIVTVNSSKPTRSNYKFIGWATDKKATTAEYKSGNQIELTGNVTLYAIWGKKVTVTLNANGGSASKKSVTAYEKTNYPSLVTPKRKGYKFTGWYTAKSGGTLVNKSVLVTKTKNHTLYAHWSKNTYTITYELNGGENNSKNKATYNVTTSTFKLNNPTKKGYTFKGWYTSNKYKTKVTQIKKGTTGNKTYYARWVNNKYQVVFKGNGSTSGKMNAKTNIKYSSTFNLPANKFSKKGYVFIGWNTKADGSGTSYENKESVSKLSAKSNGKVTLYAQWSNVPYNVTYELNGGTNDKANLTTYYSGQKVTLNNATKTGYYFAGWYTDAEFKNEITEISKTNTSNLTLYARFSASQIIIDKTSVTAEYGEKVKINVIGCGELPDLSSEPQYSEENEEGVSTGLVLEDLEQIEVTKYGVKYVLTVTPIRKGTYNVKLTNQNDTDVFVNIPVTCEHDPWEGNTIDLSVGSTLTSLYGDDEVIRIDAISYEYGEYSGQYNLVLDATVTSHDSAESFTQFLYEYDKDNKFVNANSISFDYKDCDENVCKIEIPVDTDVKKLSTVFTSTSTTWNEDEEEFVILGTVVSSFYVLMVDEESTMKDYVDVTNAYKNYITVLKNIVDAKGGFKINEESYNQIKAEMNETKRESLEEDELASYDIMKALINKIDNDHYTISNIYADEISNFDTLLADLNNASLTEGEKKTKFSNTTTEIMLYNVFAALIMDEPEEE